MCGNLRLNGTYYYNVHLINLPRAVNNIYKLNIYENTYFSLLSSLDHGVFFYVHNVMLESCYLLNN